MAARLIESNPRPQSSPPGIAAPPSDAGSMTTSVSYDGEHHEHSTKNLVMDHGLHIDIKIMNADLKARAESGPAN
jgi:hypothetical protein